METIHTLLETPPGYRSEAVARFVWQLDAQREQTLAAVAGLDPDALAWQAAWVLRPELPPPSHPLSSTATSRAPYFDARYQAVASPWPPAPTITVS